jgi:hypothetical protein
VEWVRGGGDPNVVVGRQGGKGDPLPIYWQGYPPCQLIVETLHWTKGGEGDWVVEGRERTLVK